MSRYHRAARLESGNSRRQALDCFKSLWKRIFAKGYCSTQDGWALSNHRRDAHMQSFQRVKRSMPGSILTSLVFPCFVENSRIAAFYFAFFCGFLPSSAKYLKKNFADRRNKARQKAEHRAGARCDFSALGPILSGCKNSVFRNQKSRSKTDKRKNLFFQSNRTCRHAGHFFKINNFL